MKRFKSIFQVLMAVLLVFGALGALPIKSVTAVSPDLRISQVYGGGGSADATYTHDFIEIFNAGSSEVSLDGRSLQYAGASNTGNFGASDAQITVLPGVIIQPGQYYLVQGIGGTSGSALPTPDLTDTSPIALPQSSGKVALVNSALSLGCNGSSTPCSAAQLALIVDLVGYGGANYFEGIAAPALNATTAAFRVSGGCTDTDDNDADFTAAAPAPRNSASPTNICLAETAPTVASTTPDNNGTAQKTDNIVITFSEPVTVADGWYSISCGTSGAHTASVTDADPIYTLNPDPDFTAGETCTVTIDATKVNDDDTDDTPYNYMAANYVFSFSIAENCGDAYTPIYNTQESVASSPLVGTTVTTEGVVVGDFQVGGKAGYFIQDPSGDDNPATSDGIFVYNTSVAVNVGDSVRVKGAVSEWATETDGDTLTELTPTSPAASNVTICSTGNTIAPTTVSLPVSLVSDFEKYEGMLVTFPQALVISEYFDYDRYGEIVLTSRRHMTPTAVVEPGAPAQAEAAAFLLDRITLDDGRSTSNPDPARHPNGLTFNLNNLFRGGDTVQYVTGVMDYGFGLYRIQPTIGATYTPVNVRPAAPEIMEGDLKVASFNVLNYFVTLDGGTSAWICGPNGTQECRGADNAEEFTRQTAKILAALTAIDADIFGLMEIENDRLTGEGDAVADLVAGLNNASLPGTYAYIDTGTIGTDAIKQAILYKPASVTPVGAYKLLTTVVDARFVDTLNRPVLAQVFSDNKTGVQFVVAVNHLKSKGSDCNVVGDPDLGDGQGNCNLTRKAAAQALVDWLANPTYFSGVQKMLIIGDLNSYDKEEPIDAIKIGADDAAGTADDFKDMIFEKRGDMAYGYVFDGQMDYLDHALVSQQLAADIVDVNFWHINADEPDLIDYDTSSKLPAQDALYAPDAYRSSDHDPVLVSLSFNNAPAAVEDAYSTAEDTQLVVATPGVLSNDTDIDLDILTAWLVADVAHGTLALSADGSFTYTPDLNFNGEDSFTYKAFDGTLYSNVVTVTITVTPANDAPVLAEIGAQSGNEDTLITFTASASDVDLPAQVLSFSLTGTVPTGTIIDALTGVFTWTPTDPGVYTFNVQVCDDASMALCDTEEITITVLAVIVNTAPVAVADPYSMIGNTELVVAAPGVLTNDSDADGDALTAVLVDNVTNGTLALADDGSFTYTPTAGFYGDASYTYKAFDGELYSEVVTVTITVIKPNGAPVALADAFTTAEDTQLVVDAAEGVLANDTDPDSVSLTAGLVDDVTKGTLSLAADGSFTYMPNAGFFGVDSFTYKAFDGESYSEVVTVTITVTEEIPVFFNIYLPLIFK